MHPVENETSGSFRMRPEIGHKRLNESQHGGDDSDDGMRIGRHRYGRPSSQFDKDDDKSNDCQYPSDD